MSGVEIPTPGDETDVSGHCSVLVPPGTYDVAIRPHHLSLSQAATVPAITVAGPTTLDQALPLEPVAVDIAQADGVALAAGQPLFIHAALYNLTPATQGFWHVRLRDRKTRFSPLQPRPRDAGLLAHREPRRPFQC